MILSRLLLNPRSREVRRDLGDIYQLHRTVLSGFPSQMPAEERVLFRVDEVTDGRRLLLVQSIFTRPEWVGLPAGYLLPPDPFDPLPNPAVREDALGFHEGQLLRFRLRANPTVKKVMTEPTGEKSGQGRRMAIVREADQLEWLGRKGRSGGFRSLNHVQVIDMGRAFGYIWRARNGSERVSERVELNVVQFDGLLQVTDSELFGRTLLQGIGSGKGFGCGLLSLARA